MARPWAPVDPVAGALGRRHQIIYLCDDEELYSYLVAACCRVRALPSRQQQQGSIVGWMNINCWEAGEYRCLAIKTSAR